MSGRTNSADWTSGGFDVSFNGEDDAFVVKLDSSGQHLWSTYLGGSGWDSGSDVAVDASGVYVTGYVTNSPGWTSGGFDTSFNGGDDAFVAKLSFDGAHLWSTYLGGSGTDWGAGIAVDILGDVYVTGSTNSTGWISGGFFTSYRGGVDDAFVVKLSPAGAHLWSTYLGGSDADVGADVVAFELVCIYVTGSTRSVGWGSGGFDSVPNGGLDAFVTMLKLDGQGFSNTYLGGSHDDRGSALAVVGYGDVCVVGDTTSSGWTSYGFDSDFHGGSDVFVATLGGAYSHNWSAYLGGSQDDRGYGVAVNGSDIYVAGCTYSADWTTGGFDTSYNGGADAFVARLSGAADRTPPTPNPSTWAVEPYATGQTSIRMVATTASDESGVQYYFDCLTFGGHDSGWQDSDTYEDTGLLPSRTYAYHVWTQDLSASHNVTLFSELCSATTLPEATPPTIESFGVSATALEVGGALTISYTVSDSGGSGLSRVKLFRTSDPNSWPTVRLAETVLSGDGPVSGTFSDLPPSAGDWWYSLYVSDRSGNSITEAQGGFAPIHVVVTDTTPPTPNPSTWATGPYATTETSLRMLATAASDAGGVQYYFHCLTPGGHDSGWQDSSTYDDAGLLPSTTYTYQVKTRDKSAAQNETACSVLGSATTQPPDTTAPSPNPSRWETKPGATGSTVIRMVATAATDDTGVEYYFHETTGNAGATDSGWQDSSAYEDTGLTPGTTYTYEVKTRDKAVAQNETAYSLAVAVTTPSPVYRFWKQSDDTHFYTIKESEKQKLIANYASVYTYEGVAYYAYVKDLPLAGTLPVYRFWKPSDDTHFYTMDGSETQKLINDYSNIYTFEGVAYYAFLPGLQPTGTLPVCRFWKASDNTHFYTIKESEKDKLISLFSYVFTYEKMVWYAYGV